MRDVCALVRYFRPPMSSGTFQSPRIKTIRFREAKSYLNAELFGEGFDVAPDEFGQVRFHQAVADKIERRLSGT